VLRGKKPALVWQQLYGLTLACCAVRKLLYEAALKVDLSPDLLSFLHIASLIRYRSNLPEPLGTTDLFLAYRSPGWPNVGFA
jgi:hypothetical protein